MEYFKLLDLDREPFSNSPDPEFFFESAMHVQCLQQLEMALRLKRGLSVVLGPVGTGKSTLCRQLLRRCADDARIGVHLILDPSFASPRRFLEHLAQLLRIDAPEEDGAAPDFWQLKERLKNYLFQQGVEQDRITLLVIDEGQKLSRESLELLRELLNYETNQSKLLQIIIFAQEEFAAELAAMPNFQDRVNLLYHLTPLNFAETRAMIRFRLAQAHPTGAPPVRFTYLGMALLYRASEGYPRQIIHLCHKVVMTLIIQNRTTAGARLVRFAIRGGGRQRPLAVRPALAGALVVLLAGGGIFYYYGAGPAVLAPEIPARAGVTAAAVPAPGPAAPQSPEIAASAAAPGPAPAVRAPAAAPLPAAKAPVPAPAAPAAGPAGAAAGIEQAFFIDPAALPLLGPLTVRERDTLIRMLARIYGAEQPGPIGELLALVQAVNAGLRDPDRIVTGSSLLFPHPGREFDPAPGYWLELGRSPDLAGAYDLLKEREGPATLRLALVRDRAGAPVYLVLLNRHFASAAAATAARAELVAAGVLRDGRPILLAEPAAAARL